MSLFKRHIVMRIGRQGRLAMIALLWLSATENKVFILCQIDVSSLISPMRPPPHHHHPTASPPPHPLNLLSWFRITVQRHGLLVQLLLPLLPVRRGATAIFAFMQLLDCCCIRNHDSILHVLGCAVWGLQPMLMCAHFSLLHLDLSTGFDMPIKRR